MSDISPPKNEDSLPGVLYALTAYLLWGILPIYMKAVAHIPMPEVIAHRVLWSLPLAGVVILVMGRTQDLRVALRTPRMLGMGAVTAALVSMNWGIYVWAIGAGYALEAALGYYINPLFSVLMGRVLLGERLSPGRWVAIGLAAAAVALLTYDAGRLPFVALGLTVTWGFYAYFKKSLPIGPNQGFMLEVTLLSPFAIGFLIWLSATGQGHFMQGVPRDTLLLIGSGFVTAIPLMIYANGAKRLTLSTIAMMQYISPTLIFLTAVFLFDEPFDGVRLIAYPMIWVALVIFSLSMWRGRGRREPSADPQSSSQSSSVTQTGT